jgi:hypothetical protein
LKSKERKKARGCWQCRELEAFLALSVESGDSLDAMLNLPQATAEAWVVYLGHLISKSETYVSTISLASHLAFTRSPSCQEDRDQASHCSMNTYTPLQATRQRDDVFSSPIEEGK